MSLNTPGSQQRLPASRYSSRCWYCNGSGHYRRNWPKYKFSETSRSGFGKRQQGVAHEPGGCKNDSKVGPATKPDVNNALPQSLSKQEMICPDTPMDISQVKNNLRGLSLTGFIGGTRVMWLIDTGAACSILSFKIYDSLPAGVKFCFSSSNPAIALADGQQAKTHGVGHVVVRLGTKEFQCMWLWLRLKMRAFWV